MKSMHNRVSALTQEQDSELKQGQTSKLSQSRASELKQGQDSKLSQNQASELKQEQDSKLSQSRASEIKQEQDSKLSQSRASEIKQEQDSKLSQSRASEIKQEQDSKLSQNQSSEIKQTQTSELNQNRASEIRQNQSADIKQGRAPALTLEAPSVKQKLFLKAKTKHIGFGGARGGGKSWAVRTKAILLSLRYPGIKLLIVRRTYPELMGNHIRILRSQLAGIAKYNDKDKLLRFFNGSTISFSYCACDKDLDRLQGVEYDIIFLDEATQLSEFQMKSITACLRGVGTFPKRIYYTCNPGGQGHGYIKRIFIDRRYEEGENKNDYTFIQSLVTDNAALMRSQPDYIKQLEALPPKLRDAWLYGRWDVYEGQFFEEFADRPEHYRDRRYSHVIAPFDIPPDWRIFRSFDWGYNRPFSCGWWAVDHDGTAYRILELYGCTGTPNEGVRFTPKAVFSEIHRIETEHPFLTGKHITGIADPAIWDAETGESIAETAAHCGVHFIPGDHKRIPGWLQVHYRMAFDREGFAMMYVFSNCRAFIRTIPTLLYDTSKPEDLNTDGEDHVADEVRYFCMSRPISPRSAEPDDYRTNPLRMFLDIPRESLRKLPPPDPVGRIEIIE